MLQVFKHTIPSKISELAFLKITNWRTEIGLHATRGYGNRSNRQSTSKRNQSCLLDDWTQKPWNNVTHKT
jgi:hypothetical protein